MADTKITDGKINALGVDIQISDIIGEKLVNQWVEQLSEEQMTAIFDGINTELFTNSRYTDPEKIVLKKTQIEDSWGRTEDTPFWKICKVKLSEKFADIITAKTEEIINSEEYQKRADQIAEELVEYATNSYKDDMKERLRQRLVNNVTDTYPSYLGNDLLGIIHDEVHRIINSVRY